MEKRRKFKKYFEFGIRPEDDEFLFENAKFVCDKTGTRIISLEFDKENIYKLRKDGSKALFSEDAKSDDPNNPVKVARMKFYMFKKPRENYQKSERF